MRSVVLLVLATACGSDADIDAPDDCAVDEVHIVHGSADERITLTNHAFINKFGSQTVGTLDLSSPGGAANGLIHVEFNKLAADGDVVDARGRVTLPSGIDVGNCDTEGFPGKFHVVGDGVWRWELRGLHDGPTPYCGNGAVAASLSGCYRAE